LNYQPEFRLGFTFAGTFACKELQTAKFINSCPTKASGPLLAGLKPKDLSFVAGWSNKN
jgi:hypothetical protein